VGKLGIKDLDGREIAVSVDPAVDRRHPTGTEEPFEPPLAVECPSDPLVRTQDEVVDRRSHASTSLSLVAAWGGSSLGRALLDRGGAKRG
jgi:hypothetical protein